MNKFVIVDGLPYLLADDGKTYAVRWDDKGFTVGAEVELASVPAVTYRELSILALCAGHLDSIGGSPIDENESKSENDKLPDNDESNNELPDNELSDGVFVSHMSIAELKKYAEEKGIDLGSARKKAEIIDKINAFVE